MLKATHASGWNFVFNKSHLESLTNTLQSIQQFLNKYNTIYDNHEQQYKYIKPRFFIEEKIDDLYIGKTGNAIVFMVRCIHGNPISIGVKLPISYKIKTSNGVYENQFDIINLLYDTNWNIIIQPDLIKKYKDKNINIDKFTIPKPIKLDIMLENAKILSNRFEFVRIDYYIDKNHDIYFSEFTFTPAGGNITFDPKIEFELGKTWT